MFAHKIFSFCCLNLQINGSMLALNIVKWKGRGTDYTKFCLPLKPTQKGENLPYSGHMSTVCGDKIRNLPADFARVFMAEKSYFTASVSNHVALHRFLYTGKE